MKHRFKSVSRAFLTPFIPLFLIKSRTYQIDHTDRIITALSTKRKVLCQLPTGGGKTVEFSLITQSFVRAAYEFVKSGHESVLILVHRAELLQQAHRTIKEMLNIDSVLIDAKADRYMLSRVYIGMVDSVTKRMDLMANVGLVIIDECHIGSFNKIHTLFTTEKILGFSATPIGTSKLHPLKSFYETIIVGPQINELIEMGFLAQNITRCPPDIVDSSKFSVDKLKGDYREGEMSTEYRKGHHVNNVVMQYFKYCKGQKTIIFNVSIEHSKDVNYAFNYCGYPAKHLDSNCSEQERKDILKWFKETDDAILNNVMIATVGFDEPTIRNVMLNFSTLSLVKFIQCSGRGSRRIDKELAEILGCEEKHHFNIIDMGGNCNGSGKGYGFGDWNFDRNWERIFKHPDEPGEGIAPVKTCPSCQGLVHAATTVCKLTNENGEKCLWVFDRKKAGEEKQLGDLVLITKGINLEELINKNKNKYDYYTFFEIGEKMVMEMYEKHRDVSQAVLDRTFDEYYDKCKEWYVITLAGKDGRIMDISKSQWHITRARNNFNSCVEKYKKEYQVQSNRCHNCGKETDEACEICEYPVCEKCMTKKIVNNDKFYNIICSSCADNELSALETVYQKRRLA